MSRAAAANVPLARQSASAPCAHCGLETVRDDLGTLTVGGWASSPNSIAQGEESSVQPLVFCCHGCLGAYAMIHELGLDDFYALRSPADVEPHPVRGVRRSDVLADLDAAGIPVDRTADGLCKVRLSVDGIHCAACSWLIESMQPTMQGVKSVRVRWSDTTVELLYDPEQTEPLRIAERLAKLGYSLGPIDDSAVESGVDVVLRREHWIGIATAFFLASNAMWIGISLYAGEASGMAPAHAQFLRWMGAILGLLAAVFPGRIFFRSAIEAIRAGVPHVDIPVALGLAVGTMGSIVGAALGTGNVYFDSLASLVFLLRVGRYIQFRAQYRTGLSIGKLLRMNSVVAQRIQNDGSRLSVPSYRLQPMDSVEVLPGQVIPADGQITEGKSRIQTAFITGESLPCIVHIGSSVVGGSLNLQSPITMRVTAAGEKSRMGRLSELVRAATAQRTPLIQLADRVGGVFVFVVLGLSVMTFGYWYWQSGWERATQHSIALLTIACPCALALAAPLVITVALGRAAKQNIWIRDGNCLERLAKSGIMWFDKTGTLTYGDLRVLEWSGSKDALPYVAALERQSDHPVARAIVAYLATEHALTTDVSLEVRDVEQLYGDGIEGLVEGCKVRVGRERLDSSVESECEAKNEGENSQNAIGVWIDGERQGEFVLGDQSRVDGAEMLISLQQRGWKLGILSGDRQPVVNALAHELLACGVVLEQAIGDCTPEQKLSVITQSQGMYPVTVMVGDGINDAAALATADVGIAIRGNGEACLKHAPIYIPSNQLRSIASLMDASRNTVSAIYRCFAASLLYNAITIALAVTGFIHPLIAALFMPLSGLTVLTMAMTARTFPSLGSEFSNKRKKGSF
ncbi:MAG: heavy metal translocating P-type ATPase metal-binding domain-containing protein [Planctomycetota bacterium]